VKHNLQYKMMTFFMIQALKNNQKSNFTLNFIFSQN
jgi:hypothetical protein